MYQIKWPVGVVFKWRGHNKCSTVTLVFKQELNAFRGKCSMLFHYDMISVPLVYTQVRQRRGWGWAVSHHSETARVKCRSFLK